MITSDSVKTIAKALCDSQKEFGPLVKDAKNDHYGNRYATLKACCDVALPVLNKHDVVVIQGGGAVPTDGPATNVVIMCRLQHTSGEYFESVLVLPLGPKLTAQAAGSAVTYGRRYLLCAMTGIAPEDDDGNDASTGPRPTSAKRRQGVTVGDERHFEPRHETDESPEMAGEEPDFND